MQYNKLVSRLDATSSTGCRAKYTIQNMASRKASMPSTLNQSLTFDLSNNNISNISLKVYTWVDKYARLS